MKYLSPVAPLVSLRKLEFILGIGRDDLRRIAKNVDNLYHPFRKRKPDGKDYRIIDNPNDPILLIQKRILRNILETLHLPIEIKGGIRKRNLADNAALHTGKGAVLSLDLRRFFTRTRYQQVFGIFRRHFGASTEIANLLTRLTTFRGCLPQGAATSNYIAGIAVLPLHGDLLSFTTERNLDFSFWVDDLTISGRFPAQIAGDIETLIKRHGYAIKWRKHRMQPSSGRQEVPGAVVNMTVSRGRRRSNGAGLEDYRRQILSVAKGRVEEEEIERIRGMISSVGQISRRQGLSLKRLAESRIPSFRGPVIPQSSR